MIDTRQRYVLYLWGHRQPDLYSRIYTPIFYELYQANIWCEHVLEGEGVRREGNTLHLDSGIRLKSDQLDLIMNHHLTREQVSWELPEREVHRLLRFRHGSWDEAHVTITSASPPRTAEVERRRRPERPVGYVTITELCAASGMAPPDARAMLRASGLEKPSYGWAFDPKQVPEIKKLCGM